VGARRAAPSDAATDVRLRWRGDRGRKPGSRTQSLQDRFVNAKEIQGIILLLDRAMASRKDLVKVRIPCLTDSTA
jgi:hypothetical protein